MLLIGISGYARSGKDSIAAALVERCDFVRVSFADRIKNLALHVHPELRERVEAEGWEAVKADPEVRELLQRLGVGAREVIGEDVWVRAALRGVGPDDRAVISDVRFPNEAEAVRGGGGLLIRVERPGVGPVNAHVTEVAMDCWTDWDARLVNDGTLEELQAAAVQVVQRLEAMPRPASPIEVRASERRARRGR